MDNNTNTIYIGAIQASHGHDYLFLFTMEEVKKKFEENEIELDYIPKSENENGACYDILWPMGGSNSSATTLYYLEGKKAAKDFLTRGCWGPDSEDPMLIDLAEYVWSIETDEGHAKEILDEYGINPEDYTQYDERVKELEEKYGLTTDDLYSDKWSDVRYSEVEEMIEEN